MLQSKLEGMLKVEGCCKCPYCQQEINQSDLKELIYLCKIKIEDEKKKNPLPTKEQIITEYKDKHIEKKSN